MVPFPRQRVENRYAVLKLLRTKGLMSSRVPL